MSEQRYLDEPGVERLWARMRAYVDARLSGQLPEDIPLRELTQAQYDALSAEEKAAEIAYLIPDAPGTGAQVSVEDVEGLDEKLTSYVTTSVLDAKLNGFLTSPSYFRKSNTNIIGWWGNNPIYRTFFFGDYTISNADTYLTHNALIPSDTVGLRNTIIGWGGYIMYTPYSAKNTTNVEYEMAPIPYVSLGSGSSYPESVRLYASVNYPDDTHTGSWRVQSKLYVGHLKSDTSKCGIKYRLYIDYVKSFLSGATNQWGGGTFE